MQCCLACDTAYVTGSEFTSLNSARLIRRTVVCLQTVSHKPCGTGVLISLWRHWRLEEVRLIAYTSFLSPLPECHELNRGVLTSPEHRAKVSYHVLR